MGWSEYYEELTSRNIGILNIKQQERLRKSRVAVAGCGCIGALSSELLVRAGLGHIKIADPDSFDISNINRQITALKSTVGKNKAKVLEKRLKDINPEISIDCYPEAITNKNVNKFIEDTDLIIDGMDYYAFDDMLSLHREAEKRNIPVVTAVSLAFGGNYFAFDKNSITFEEYVGYRDGMKDFLVPPRKYAPKLPKGIPPGLIVKVLKKDGPIPTIGVGQSIACGILAKESINFLAKKRKLTTVPNYISFNIDLK